MMGDMQQGFDLNDQLNTIKENRKQIGNNPEDTFNEGAFQLDLDKQEDKLREEIQDYHRISLFYELASSLRLLLCISWKWRVIYRISNSI